MKMDEKPFKRNSRLLKNNRWIARGDARRFGKRSSANGGMGKYFEAAHNTTPGGRRRSF
jgi:hypothetical protein